MNNYKYKAEFEGFTSEGTVEAESGDAARDLIKGMYAKRNKQVKELSVEITQPNVQLSP